MLHDIRYSRIGTGLKTMHFLAVRVPSPIMGNSDVACFGIDRRLELTANHSNLDFSQTFDGDK
jgi:hypothetical protein